MNISNVSSQHSIFGLTNQTSTSKKPLVRSIDSVTSKDVQEKLVTKQANQGKGIVVDQQAIALFEENQLKKNQFEENQFEISAAKSAASDRAFSTTDKDKPSLKNETAVASYQAVGNLAQRESVKQLFGVDVFA